MSFVLFSWFLDDFVVLVVGIGHVSILTSIDSENSELADGHAAEVIVDKKPPKIVFLFLSKSNFVTQMQIRKNWFNVLW